MKEDVQEQDEEDDEDDEDDEEAEEGKDDGSAHSVVVADLKFLMLEDLLDTGEQLCSLVDNAAGRQCGGLTMKPVDNAAG